uniref:Uncharacterized protein n=1 Tax=Trichogramma kaykai TaxID=54128 RepID=A0ABD2WMT0_9HYME
MCPDASSTLLFFLSFFYRKNCVGKVSPPPTTSIDITALDTRQVKRVKSRPGSISWHCSSTRHDRIEYTDEHALAASYNIHANIAEVIDSLLHCAKRDDVSLESDDDYYTTKSKFAAQRNNKLKDSKMSATSVQTNSESLSRTKIKSTRSSVYCIYYAYAGELIISAHVIGPRASCVMIVGS